ncbi:hypothetical protein [Saccharicrinis aurantiacus]|uniref:hypothetical protein n=1 Tax=Saccharicrinis aurantiacus TaxID=1849719 RepID=UPI000950250D|nr:hypothetical protein [Saccharicrinis aurantiacus]
MLKYIIIALTATCLISAFFFVYKWYVLYAKYKGISFGDIFVKGYYRPKYIDAKESNFNESQAKALNVWIYLIFTVMGIGFVLAMIFKAVS